uniref:Uncharacterized protein n=1 Tax=Lepeophtheirus salmonis TaxID=72036 RepID=A0A0K2V4Q8_LEPSM
MLVTITISSLLNRWRMTYKLLNYFNAGNIFVIGNMVKVRFTCKLLHTIQFSGSFSNFERMKKT